MSIHVQALVVIPVVAACSVYSGWSLMPAALRRRLAGVLARIRWIGGWPAVVRAAREPVGCGCDGCDRAAAPLGPSTGSGENIIRIVPRRPTS